jgi:demethylmenaquinone methyltransferase / 2-methoxy-6-polyprenyl-1,4-benzoquinol methylase
MQEVFTQQEPNTIRGLFARIAHRYDLANTLLSLGMDTLWRHHVAKRITQWNPKEILDLATGSGVLAAEILRHNQNTRLIGADFCAPMLTLAQRRGLKNLVVADGLALPFPTGHFDVVTVAFGLRNMASYDIALREMFRVLRREGHLVILDFSLPKPPLRFGYRFYLHHILPVLAGWVTGEPDAYRYFGDSIEAFPKGNDMLGLMRHCGFRNGTATPLSAGIVTVYVGLK